MFSKIRNKGIDPLTILALFYLFSQTRSQYCSPLQPRTVRNKMIFNAFISLKLRQNYSKLMNVQCVFHRECW